MTYPEYSKAYLRNRMDFPKHNAYAEVTHTAKGTRHYCITVGNKYNFYFTTKGSLLSIEDVSHGSWDTYSTKAEKEWWLNRYGSRELYEKHVLPCLYKFIESRRK